MSEPKPELVVTTGPFKKVVFLGHVSVEARDTEAGEVGATLRDADMSDLYRSSLPDVHEKTTAKIAELSGVARGVNEVQTAKNQARLKDGKTAKPVLESWTEWTARIQASVSEDIWSEIDAYVRSVALATPVDASPSKRVGAASKANLDKAEEILARDTDAMESTISKMLTIVPDYDLDRDEDSKPTKASLARLIGAYIAAM